VAGKLRVGIDMAFHWLRPGDREVDPTAVQVLQIRALSCVAIVLGIRHMPQRPRGNMTMARQSSRERGDILQREGGRPHAGRKGVGGERVGALEEGGPCCPAIPEDAVDGRRGWHLGSSSPSFTPIDRSEVGDELLLAVLLALLPLRSKTG